MIKHVIGLAALFAAVLGVAALVSAQQGNAAPEPTAVAVVDVRKVFNSLEEKGALEADLTTMREQLEQQLQQRQQRLRDAAANLNLMARDNPGFEQATRDLEQQRFEVQSWAEWQRQSMVREERLRVLSLYRKILETTGEIAQQNGYDLVFYKDEVDLESVKPDEVTQLIGSRRVIYANDELDLTDRVLRVMNSRFTSNVQQ